MGATVIVGCDAPDCSTAIIESWLDGSWDSADLGPAAGSIELHGVAFDGQRFVAAGRTVPADEGAPENAVAFMSDDGRAWRQAPDQASLHDRWMSDVVARPGGGFLAVGSGMRGSAYTAIEVWSSEDGLDWRRAYSDDSDAFASADHVAVSAEGHYVAWGTDCLTACGQIDTVLWTSVDGASWRRVADQPSFHYAIIDGMVAQPGGWLAIGTIGDPPGTFTGASLRSPDARSWTRQKLPKAAGYRMNGVVLVDGRAIALGIEEGDRYVLSRWETTEGTSWSGPSAVPRTTADFVAFTGGASLTVAAMPMSTGETTVLRVEDP